MKVRTKRKIKQIFNTVGAGVIGSVLTLTIVTNTHLLPNELHATNTETTSEQPSYSIQPASTANGSIADMVETTSKAIVGIVNKQKQVNPFAQSTESVEVGSGSGVIFKKEGDSAYIVTNNHVIENADSVDVSFENGENTTAEVIGTDALTDLAVLRVDAKFAEEILPLSNSDVLRTGDQVIAIGNPLGLDFSRTVTQGIVSATNRSITVSTSAGEWEFEVIQTDAAINPGNSGGALLNAAGELIGINSLKIAENGVEGLGFAIPSNAAKPIIEEIIKFGKVERPYLGIALAELEQIPRHYLNNLPESVKEGVVVTQVSPNAAAAKAGIEAGDVIVAMDDQPITNSSELRKQLYSSLKIGDQTNLTIYRNGKKMTVEITLEAKDMM